MALFGHADWHAALTLISSLCYWQRGTWWLHHFLLLHNVAESLWDVAPSLRFSLSTHVRRSVCAPSSPLPPDWSTCRLSKFDPRGRSEQRLPPPSPSLSPLTHLCYLLSGPLFPPSSLSARRAINQISSNRSENKLTGCINFIFKGHIRNKSWSVMTQKWTNAAVRK